MASRQLMASHCSVQPAVWHRWSAHSVRIRRLQAAPPCRLANPEPAMPRRRCRKRCPKPRTFHWRKERGGEQWRSRQKTDRHEIPTLRILLPSLRGAKRHSLTRIGLNLWQKPLADPPRRGTLREPPVFVLRRPLTLPRTRRIL